MFDAKMLAGKRVEVGGATYVFPDYCSIIGRPHNCIPMEEVVTIGIKV